MQLSLSFLSGVLFSSLFHYFPFFSFHSYYRSCGISDVKKKITAYSFLSHRFFYAFFRYYPVEDMPDIWNKELKVTGRFTQGDKAKGPERNIETFLVDTAQDE